MPTTFLDITPVWDKKVAAMEAMGAQGYLRQYYSERAEHRANHARRISGRYGHPLRRGVPAGDPRRRRRAVTDYATLARLGVATVHEAAGRTGIVDLQLIQIVPGSRVAGPARIALCAPGDNTMVHAAVAHASPGDVLVLTSAEPAPVALIGELLATQAQAQGVAGILVDGPFATSTSSG